MPASIASEIRGDNHKFTSELMEFQSSKVAKKIQDLYKARLTEVSKERNGLQPDTICFVLFLKNSRKEFELYKHVLIDICTKEAHPLGLSLEMVDEDVIKKLAKAFPPSLLRLSPHERNRLEAYKREFMDLQKNAYYVTYILRSILQNDWLKAAQAFQSLKGVSGDAVTLLAGKFQVRAVQAHAVRRPARAPPLAHYAGEHALHQRPAAERIASCE